MANDLSEEARNIRRAIASFTADVQEKKETQVGNDVTGEEIDPTLFWQEDENGDLVDWSTTPLKLLHAVHMQTQTITAHRLEQLTPDVDAIGEGPEAAGAEEFPRFVSRREPDKVADSIYLLEVNPYETAKRALELQDVSWLWNREREQVTMAGLLQRARDPWLCMIKRVAASPEPDLIVGYSIIFQLEQDGKHTLAASPFLPKDHCAPNLLQCADKYRSYFSSMVQLCAETFPRSRSDAGPSRDTVSATPRVKHSAHDALNLKGPRHLELRRSIQQFLLRLHPTLVGVPGLHPTLVRAPENSTATFIAPTDCARADLPSCVNQEQSTAAPSERLVSWLAQSSDAASNETLIEAWRNDIEHSKALGGRPFGGEFTFAVGLGDYVQMAPRLMAGRHFDAPHAHA